MGKWVRDPEANSWKSESNWTFCISLSGVGLNGYLWMTCYEKLIKAPLCYFLLTLFLNVSLSSKFFTCAERVLGTFFWVYPGSVFEMFLTECPNELMILIVVKEEQEYKIHAALWLKLLRENLTSERCCFNGLLQVRSGRSLRPLFACSLWQCLSALMLHVFHFEGEPA